VSVTHNCIDCMHNVLVGSGVLFLSYTIVWVPCISLLLVYGFCVHHIIVWIPSLLCWVCGFCVPQNFLDSVFWSYICRSSMPITLATLWVLCLSHIIAWVRCLSCLLVCGFLCFGVIIFWDLTILWVLCLLYFPFCGFYAIFYTLLFQTLSTCQV